MLLVCFALYHFGYYAFYFSYEHHLEKEWESQIYGQTSSEQVEMLMEIPLSMPYMANQEDFQPTNTPFEKDGRIYRAIKQRYQNDTLQVVYVPDTARKALITTVKSWISSLADDTLPQDQKGQTQLKLFVKDYIETGVFRLANMGSPAPKDKIGFIFSPYMSPCATIDSPPPKFS